MTEIAGKIESLITPLLEGSDMFLVGVKIKPINNIKVFIDADSGFSIEKSISVNRKLYASIEELQLFPDGDFSLEVSSPGVDEPLVQRRQYNKNIGRKVTITDAEGNEKTGMLKAVEDDHVTLEVKGAKAKDGLVTLEIPFSNIKKTIVQIIF